MSTVKIEQQSGERKEGGGKSETETVRLKGGRGQGARGERAWRGA
jgi:hypothetical protein|tara:strand:- start:285 stop:419 length:135 start_codon:yes stop_codon:yes gene_type:complete